MDEQKLQMFAQILFNSSFDSTGEILILSPEQEETVLVRVPRSQLEKLKAAVPEAQVVSSEEMPSRGSNRKTKSALYVAGSQTPTSPVPSKVAPFQNARLASHGATGRISLPSPNGLVFPARKPRVGSFVPAHALMADFFIGVRGHRGGRRK